MPEIIGVDPVSEELTPFQAFEHACGQLDTHVKTVVRAEVQAVAAEALITEHVPKGKTQADVLLILLEVSTPEEITGALLLSKFSGKGELGDPEMVDILAAEIRQQVASAKVK